MIYESIQYEIAKTNKGYTNRLLEIDLTKNTIAVKNISDQTRRIFIGGRGYCLKLVYDNTTSATRYDSPENMLAVAGGPFCGETGFVGSGKFIVGAISPMTGSFCDSNVGGYFFPMVKKSGFDAIAVTGKSNKDVVVIIDGDAGEIRIADAPETKYSLYGVEELFEQFKDGNEPEDIAIITAGTGAKNTFFGCVNSIYYDTKRKRCRAKQAGRGGLGTVMRDKGLWGVVVKRDRTGGFPNNPANPRGVREAGKKLRYIVGQVDPKAMNLREQGTTALIDMMNPNELLPVNNYQYGSDDRSKDVSGSIFAQKVFKQKMPDGCFAGCNLGCTKGCEQYTLKTGPLAGKTVAVDGPEYETAAVLTNLGIFDIDYMLEYAWYCDEYGIDTISAGVLASFLFEAYERGFLISKDTNGLELKWNSPQIFMEFIHFLAKGEKGFFTEAGRGSRHMKSWIALRAASRNGQAVEKILAELSLFAMECKGLEFSLYVTKESLAQQGGYAFALKGAQHDESWLIGIDQINRELPTFRLKAGALTWFPLFRTWFNVVGLCKLPWIDVRHPDAKNTEDPSKNMPTIEYYIEFVNAMLGTNKTLDDLLAESERCYLLHKLINLRQGFGTREHDRIPLRAKAPVYLNEFESRKAYYKEYLQQEAKVDITGCSDKELLDILQNHRREQFEKLTDAVYKEKGYDENGIPFDSTLQRLGFDDAQYFDIVRASRRDNQ